MQKTVKYQKYRASAPGSLMLMGEHAVLHGKIALVCAINRLLSVTLSPRRDRVIHIKSSVLGELVTSLDEIEIKNPFSFILQAIILKKKQLYTGFDLTVTADFSAQMGFGSSAAVTVATLAVLRRWLGQEQSAEGERHKLFLEARRVVRMVQGIGSGADVAASIWGGVVVYGSTPLMIKKIANMVPLTVVYSGKKVATKQVVEQVLELRSKNHQVITMVEAVMEECVRKAILAIKKRNWQKLGELANISQGCHDSLGVNTLSLSQAIYALRQTPGIYGAKISGSGMGDSVIGIGKIKKTKQVDISKKTIETSTVENVTVTSKGYKYEI